MVSFWAARRVMVTGRAGFLSSAVVRRLHEAGATQIFVPRAGDYDLRKLANVDRALADGRPDCALDTSRAHEAFGSSARMPWENGLRATIDWYGSRRRADS